MTSQDTTNEDLVQFGLGMAFMTVAAAVMVVTRFVSTSFPTPAIATATITLTLGMALISVPGLLARTGATELLEAYYRNTSN